ncbi:RnfABCDGE type electron transport complex subunit G [candidate division WOR-3 bacterium]|nr:RnfABCDGE type electron transport complex subunit G [candidate division WOR-3 bacterium]
MTSTKNMVLTLLIVAIVCSVVLSFVYSYTEPRIAETQAQLTLGGLKQVINAQEFVEIISDTLWNAVDSSGILTGIVFRVFPQGYGGPIPITVGLDLNGKITGVRIASAAEGLKETPGLGVKITEPEFKDQFIDKCAPEAQLKSDGGEIDAITAATISSRAVCNGVKNGIETYLNYLETPIDKRCVFSDAREFVEIIKDTLWYALKDADTIGIVFVGFTQGYLDCIEFMVGVGTDAKISGVEILYSSETEGIGEAIREKEFLDKFKEDSAEAITGATVSSQVLIDAIEEYITRYKEYLK